MRFTIPRDIYFGRGSIEVLKEIKGKKAVIVTGGSSMQKSGIIYPSKRVRGLYMKKELISK